MAELRAVAENLVSAWIGANTTKTFRRSNTRARSVAMQQILVRFDDENWIDITSGDLCALANISERTLQYALNERFGTTPAKFPKARKLAATRSALKQTIELADN